MPMRTVVALHAIAAIWLLCDVVAANAAGPFDGNYRGSMKLVAVGRARGGAPAKCTGDMSGVAAARRVVDNKLTLPFAGSDFTADVAADGAVSGAGWRGRDEFTAKGKITGGALVVDYGTRFCMYRFEGRKAR